MESARWLLRALLKSPLRAIHEEVIRAAIGVVPSEHHGLLFLALLACAALSLMSLVRGLVNLRYGASRWTARLQLLGGLSSSLATLWSLVALIADTQR